MTNPDALWGIAIVVTIVGLMVGCRIAEARAEARLKEKRRQNANVQPRTNHDAQNRSDDWRYWG